MSDTPPGDYSPELDHVLKALTRFLDRHLPASEDQEVRFPYIDLVRGLGDMGVRLTDAQAARLLADGAFRLDTPRSPRGSVLTPADTKHLLTTGFELWGDDGFVTTRRRWAAFLTEQAKATAATAPAAAAPAEDDQAAVATPTVGHEEHEILAVLSEVAPRRLVAQDIAARLGKAKTTVAGFLPGLEQKGLVERPHGRRSGYALTPLGMSLMS
jgi:hypothetical protein